MKRRFRRKRPVNTVEVHTMVTCSELDDAMQKLERLHQLLKEANSLVDELASKGVKVTVSM